MNWNDFTKRYGTSVTSDRQLIEWAKELGIPHFSCIMRDQIKDLNKHKDHNIIVNLQTEAERGSHWEALYKKGDTAYYFSSYALPPLKEVKDFTGNCKKRYHNTHQLQNTSQEYCGQMTLYVLYQLSRGNSFEDIILSLIK